MDEGAKIPCSEAVEQLWTYLDQALSDRERARVDEHLAFCRRCCGELEFAKELRSFLAAHAVDEEPPPFVRERLERFVEDIGG